ncbi:hypothetical protein H7J81_20445 [Mycobacterium cookii]|nr:hypothetical protein [Mycobacterium cookii]
MAACSSSSNDNTAKPPAPVSPTSVAPKPPPAPPMGHDEVEGLVRSVSGNTIQLTQRDRTAAAVDFTPTTMVTELGPAALTDVTPGSCVDVQLAAPNGPPGGPVTAQLVTISPSEGGKCAPAPNPGVNGTVSSVSGNVIAVNAVDPTGKTTPATADVTEATTYNKHAVTNTQAIQNGKCMAAQGIKNAGVLQAATIDLEPCPPMGSPHHHFFHIPHLPHIHHH